MWSAYDQAKRSFFAGHPLGNSILGTPDTIRALTRTQMHDYFERRYLASNITVVAAGNFGWRELTALVKDQCGRWSDGPAGRKGIRPARGSGAFEVLSKSKVTQEHVFLISPGPAAKSPLRYAADSLALAIGDDSGSRLYWALVDRSFPSGAATVGGSRAARVDSWSGSSSFQCWFLVRAKHWRTMTSGARCSCNRPWWRVAINRAPRS